MRACILLGDSEAGAHILDCCTRQESAFHSCQLAFVKRSHVVYLIQTIRRSETGTFAENDWSAGSSSAAGIFRGSTSHAPARELGCSLFDTSERAAPPKAGGVQFHCAGL